MRDVVVHVFDNLPVIFAEFDGTSACVRVGSYVRSLVFKFELPRP
jgi:hypothetical protein